MQVFIDANAARASNFQSGRTRQRCFRANPDCQDHDIGLQALAVVQVNDGVVGLVFKTFDLGRKIQLNMLFAHVGMHDGGHFGIERGKDLVCAFDQRHEQPSFMQVFSHLDADEAATDNYGTARLCFVHVAHDVIQIGNVAQAENAL